MAKNILDKKATDRAKYIPKFETTCIIKSGGGTAYAWLNQKSTIIKKKSVFFMLILLLIKSSHYSILFI